MSHSGGSNEVLWVVAIAFVLNDGFLHVSGDPAWEDRGHGDLWLFLAQRIAPCAGGEFACRISSPLWVSSLTGTRIDVHHVSVVCPKLGEKLTGQLHWAMKVNGHVALPFVTLHTGAGAESGHAGAVDEGVDTRKLWKTTRLCRGKALSEVCLPPRESIVGDVGGLGAIVGMHVPTSLEEGANHAEAHAPASTSDNCNAIHVLPFYFLDFLSTLVVAGIISTGTLT